MGEKKMKPVCEPSARASRELDILHHIYNRAGRACNEKGQKHLGDYTELGKYLLSMTLMKTLSELETPDLTGDDPQ
jgi:hypothetical protein